MAASIDDRLRDLGIKLPDAPQPLTDHASIVASRGLAYLAGHGPTDSQRNPVVVGAVGAELTEEDGNRAARLAALNAVATMRAALGSLDRVEQVVRLTGYVLSAPGFARQPWVVDGASQLLVQIFGPERGRHARTSVGVNSSALRMAVTIDIVIAIS